MQQSALSAQVDTSQVQQLLLRERQATHLAATTSTDDGAAPQAQRRGVQQQLTTPGPPKPHLLTAGTPCLPGSVTFLEHSTSKNTAQQRQEDWSAVQSLDNGTQSQQMALSGPWPGSQTDLARVSPPVTYAGPEGTAAPDALGIGGLHIPLPSPPVGGHSSQSESLTFDSIFQNIMDQKAMQAQQQPDLTGQRASTTPSDMSMMFHHGQNGSMLLQQASLEQFQHSHIGRSLSTQASLEQLLHSVSMDRLLEMSNELFIPALDTEGGWDIESTPLSLSRGGGLTPGMALPAIVNRDGTTSPSLSPQRMGLDFDGNGGGTFAERPPEVMVTLVPRTTHSGRETDKVQVQLDEDSSFVEQPRKRRRAGKVPPKLAAILENERSPPSEAEDAEAEDAPGSQHAEGSQAYLEGLPQSSADVRRDKNREAARRMRLKKQQALINLQTEVVELEALNTTLISRLESLLNWLEGTNRENSMLRQLLQCLDIPAESRAAQPVLAQLHNIKTALSGPANQPAAAQANAPAAAQLSALQLTPEDLAEQPHTSSHTMEGLPLLPHAAEHKAPQPHAAHGQVNGGPIAAAVPDYSRTPVQLGSFVGGPASSPSMPIARVENCQEDQPAGTAGCTGAVHQDAQGAHNSLPSPSEQQRLAQDQQAAEMGPPPPQATQQAQPLRFSPGTSTVLASSQDAADGNLLGPKGHDAQGYEQQDLQPTAQPQQHMSTTITPQATAPPLKAPPAGTNGAVVSQPLGDVQAPGASSAVQPVTFVQGCT